jgi:NitT/TauT family transport system ATP-binding protein
MQPLISKPHNEKPYVVISDLTKSFKQDDGRNLEVLANINMTLGKGEFVAIIGPNGCGKTTFLLVLAQILTADRGIFRIQGELPQKGNVGLIFQNYRETLLPWQSALDNIAFSLQAGGISKNDRRAKVEKFIHELGVEVPLSRHPHRLSGGQQQIVSILRSVISDPLLLLMDEPFSALDYRARRSVHASLQKIFARTQQTVLFVSHDIDEAILLADRVIVLSNLPARIAGEFPVNISRPRDESLVVDKDFLAIKHAVFECFDVMLKQGEVAQNEI